MLIGHGFLFGYAADGSDIVVRGRRLLCSRRFRRAGCGHTFSVLLAPMIAGFSVRTCTLSRLLSAVLSGLCINAAWTQLATTSLSLRSGYRLWRRLLAAQSHLRTTLASTSSPPACTDAQPLAQLLDHLKHVLGTTDCVFAVFQLTFQRHLFG